MPIIFLLFFLLVVALIIGGAIRTIRLRSSANQTGRRPSNRFTNDDMMQQQMMRDQMMQSQLDQQMLEQQQMMHDPYVNPGQDIVVDESYHGIDHGMGIADPDQNLGGGGFDPF